MLNKGAFFWVSVISAIIILAFLALPMISMMAAPEPSAIREALTDKLVVDSVLLSLYTAGMTSLICLVVGTPFAYLLARKEFPGKRLLLSIVDIPIVIPHPVVGIAILGVTGRNHWFGRVLIELGIRVMGSKVGIIAVMVFVAIPFFINAAREGFASVSPRLENISMSLGASKFATFRKITLPLAWRSILAGLIMSAARALSEFGAVVVVAYHPMIAPVLMYERYEAYGLRYSQPVAFILVVVSLLVFIALRFATAGQSARVEER
ncbi:MAG: ABC transporter permease [Candidatus Fermentibacteria bacterium]|nr:ABC transporter permease [Candidatus Fermentibacteria bacterium]